MRSVEKLVADLGPALVLGVGGDLHTELSLVTVSDPVHPVPMTPQAVVVAIGHPLSDHAELLAEAAAARAPALLIKGSELPQINPSGPALIVIEPAADWGHVIALARLSINDAAEFGAQADDSLFAVADALASLCSGSVVVHDPAWQLVAYSGGDAPDEVRTATLLGRRAPSDALAKLRDAGVIARLLRGELVHLADDEITGMTERYAAAVLVGGQQFGSIWLMPSGDSDEEQTLLALRRAVDIAGLALLRHAAVSTGPSAEHDVTFAGLLSGMHTERQVAQHLGTSVDDGFLLAGLNPLAGEPAERAAGTRRLVALARGYCEAYRIRAAVAPAGDVAFLLFSCPGPAERDVAIRVVNDLRERLERSLPHRAVVGSAYPLLAQTPEARASVQDLLQLSERRGWSGVTDAEAVDASWRLTRLQEIAHAYPTLLEGPGMRLLEQDRASGGELVTTLRAYFDAVGDVRAAAARLGLHDNTVRYRLRRAQEVSGLDVNDADQRLLCELQVRILTD